MSLMTIRRVRNFRQTRKKWTQSRLDSEARKKKADDKKDQVSNNVQRRRGREKRNRKSTKLRATFRDDKLLKLNLHE